MNAALPLSVAALALVAYATYTPPKPGRVYDRPVAEVRSALADTDVPMHLFGSQSPDIERLTDDPANIQWKVVLNGSEVMRFVATTEADGPERTRVVVSVEGAQSSKFGDVGQRLKSKPMIRALYRQTMSEAIDARLTNRPFDITTTYPTMIGAARNELR